MLADLAALAATANLEHQGARRAATATLIHAVRAGEALRVARRQLPNGAWGKWLTENFEASHYTANLYMRFAKHREVLTASGAHTWNEAVGIIRELDGNAYHIPSPSEYRQLQAGAVAMASEGKDFSEIGRALQIHRRTAKKLVEDAESGPPTHERRRLTPPKQAKPETCAAYIERAAGLARRLAEDDEQQYAEVVAALNTAKAALPRETPLPRDRTTP